MTGSTKLQITLSETAMQKLIEMTKDKGITKSSIIALALDKLYKNEKGEERGK
jgi:hypothetical protein